MPENFYGNLTTPQQPTFVFDKVYTSRWELMQHQDDGVLVGRYALVTYGAAETVLGYYNNNNKTFYHTYTQNTQVSPQFDNVIDPKPGVVYENLLAGSWRTRYYYYTNSGYHLCSMEEGAEFNLAEIDETDPLYTYFDNVFQDITHSLEPAHNSVFIKLYSKDQGYYYREIASLNEYLPQVECIIDAPFTGGYVNVNMNNERLRAPYLLKSGLTYELHMSQTPLYRIGSIKEYNTEGFSPFEHCDKNLIENSFLNVGLTYQPTHYKSYPYNARDINAASGSASPSATGALPDVYDIHINFAEIGNTIAQVWDVVYGSGAGVATETTSGQFVTRRVSRDTTINSTYEVAHNNPGGKDTYTLRGIANIMLELIGYEGHEREENSRGEWHYKDLDNADQYIPKNQIPPEGWTPVYDLTTVRGLLAKGMEVSDQLDHLDATLIKANEDLEIIEGLLGENDSENLDTATIYGILNTLSQDIANIQAQIGTPQDTMNENAEPTIWGIYNSLSGIDLTSVIALLGRGEKHADEDTILNRLAALEDWQEEVSSYWVLGENGVLATAYPVVVGNTFVAMDENNKVRGAMWAR